MEHIFFVIFNFLILAIILTIDKKNIKNYLFLGLFAMLLDTFFEQVPIHAGFWFYFSDPKFLGFSLYMWILYIPYLSMCYFIGNKLAGEV